MNFANFGGSFTGEPKIRKPKLPLKAKLSMTAKLRSFIKGGAFSKSSGSKATRVKQPNFTKGL